MLVNGRWWLAALVAVLAIVSAGSAPGASVMYRSKRIAPFPPVMFWAWERNEDLRGLNPRRAGVAFLAATYRLHDDQVVMQPRRQPLRVDPGTALMAVARIEVDRGHSPTWNQRHETLALSIASLGRGLDVGGVQIDFDATASERPFYVALIEATRRAVADVPLSVTALESWCLSDAWLDRLPIDEAVPMLFRLGVVRDESLKAAGAAGRFRSPACAGAVGVSTDEPIPRLMGHRRLYVFRPKAWTPAAAAAALDDIVSRR